MATDNQQQDSSDNSNGTVAVGETQLTPGTPEYDAAMVAKADAANGTNSGTDGMDTGNTEGESLLAGKYKSEDELQKGILNASGYESMEALYKAIEKGELKTPAGDGDNKPQDAGKETPPKTDDLFKDVQTEYEQSGVLSEDTLKRLSDAKIPQDMVELALAGAKAQQDAENQKVFDAVGGENKWNAMSEWAGKNLQQSEVEALNEAIQGDSAYLRNLALSDLVSRYNAEHSNPPQNKLTGQPGAQDTGSSGYTSIQEMTKAMSDPRYQTDPAYRQEVMVKVGKSNF